MQKPEVDYTNTIIYKITCKDPNIKDIYVGHTVNFVQRKHAHKQSCNNENSCNYKCKLYETIRNNGGWNNWDMEIIHFCKCKDQYEARSKEQEYFVLLNATLNSIEPLPKPKEVVTKNIVKLHTETINTRKSSKSLFCEKCNFECIKKSDWDRHIATDKHNRSIVTNTIEPNIKQRTTVRRIEFICKKCSKSYNARNSLWYHEQKCNYSKQKQTDENRSIDQTVRPDLYTIINVLISENQEIRNLVVTQHNTIADQNKILTELVKNQSHTSNNQNHEIPLNKQVISDILIE